MANPHIKITVAGTEILGFSHFNLNQTIYDHHTFELVVNHTIIEELGSHVLDKSKDWIGKPLVAQFGGNEFHGIVTSLAMDHFAGLNGDLVISGVSPTILLETGPHNHSWNEKDLKKIVEEVVDLSGMEKEVAPQYSAPLDYIAQYRESHFDFIQRLAGTFHEWMYYDGKTLKFGKPADDTPIPVAYGKDVDSIRISMQMSPLKYEGFSYNALRDENINGKGDDNIKGLNDMGSQAMSASMEAFSTPTQSTVLPRVENKSDLDKAMANHQAAMAAQMASISGVGTVKELKPGSVAEIVALVKTGPVWIPKPYGTYRIIRISHHISGNYEYKNNFEAIPAELEILPPPKFRFPHAEPQIATVLSNQDPENKGRVQVQFLWQSGDMKSPWIRVMTPDAGSSDKVSSNRGMVTIPEEGDQVMVGFRYDDPQRPFVMGSMFHGKAGAGGGAGNATKSLTTRSGATITINDDEGDGSVTISDPSGNVITMHGDGKMSITAPNKITMSSTEIEIIASDKMHLEGTNNLDLSSKAIKGTGEDEIMLTSPAAITVEAKSTSISGSDSLKQEGKNVDINGSMVTNVKGGTLNLN